MPTPTFFWHDYETTGADARRDRPIQFAGIRTDEELRIVGEPVMCYCRPPRDSLPHPDACLITGITPQLAEREGRIEAEFTAIVHEELAAPGTCGVGYNSLRFDDEFTRHLLYRNFHDPYEREWKNGNSRWDLIDLARMCYALRPQGIEWPRREDGTPSFKLEDLATANHLQQTRAHDALSDVEALIGLARLIRTQQPRLYDFHYQLRRKQQAFQYLDVAHRTPVVHVSSRFAASRGCLAIVVPLAVLPGQPNAVVVYDLDADPGELLALDAEDIAERVFIAQSDLPEGIERIPLKLVHANRSPALAPLSVLANVDLARIGLDRDRALKHLQQINQDASLGAKVQAVFAARPGFETQDDPELNLYAGFPADADKRLFAEVRRSSPSELASPRFAFRDPRYAELLFRYRARNWPDTLNTEESERWQAWRRRRLTTDTALTPITLEAYFATLASLRTGIEASRLPLLDALEAWGRTLEAEIA